MKLLDTNGAEYAERRLPAIGRLLLLRPGEAPGAQANLSGGSEGGANLTRVGMRISEKMVNLFLAARVSDHNEKVANQAGRMGDPTSDLKGTGNEFPAICLRLVGTDAVVVQQRCWSQQRSIERTKLFSFRHSFFDFGPAF